MFGPSTRRNGFDQTEIDRAVHGERGRCLFILAYAEVAERLDLARRCVAMA